MNNDDADEWASAVITSLLYIGTYTAYGRSYAFLLFKA